MFRPILLLAVLSFLPATLPAQDVAALIAEGDKFAEQQFDNRRALEVFRKAEQLEPRNYAVLWRLSRTWVDIAEHLPAQTDEQKDEQLRQYQTALDYAQKAVAANPSGMMGYLRRAIANGRIALFKGVFSVVGLVKEVRADVEKAIRLNTEDARQLAVAHYVLARTHAKVCEKPYLVRLPLGLGWGDRDDAAEHFEKAIALNPEFIMFRVDAARNYIELEEYRQARAHLAKVPALPTKDEDDEQLRKEAVQLLASIRNR